MSTNANESPEEYLRRAGIKHTRHGDESKIECPSCGRNEGCDLNLKTGLWKCLRASCQAKGNLYQLKASNGDAYEVTTPGETSAHDLAEAMLAKALASRAAPASEVERWAIDLFNEPDAAPAMEYLRRRGFTDRTIKAARLGWVRTPPKSMHQPAPAERTGPAVPVVGVRRAYGATPPPEADSVANAAPEPAAEVRRGANGLITIPYLADPGDPASCVLVKMRWVPPEPVDPKGEPIRYQRIAGGETVLYMLGKIDPKAPLVLCAGELDAISVFQAMTEANVRGAVASTSGGEGTWKETWSAQIQTAEDVVIAYDNDAAGRAGAAKVATELGRHRCRIMGSWPGGVKDANAALGNGALTPAIGNLIEGAKAPQVVSIRSINAFTDQFLVWRRGRQGGGLPTGWPTVDALIGGWRPGEVTVVTGETGSGKTTWTFAATLNQIRAGRRTFTAAFEGGPMFAIEKFVRQWSLRSPDDLGDSQIRHAIDQLSERALLFDYYGSIKVEPLAEALLYVTKRLGVEFMVLDHIDYMVPRGAPNTSQLKNELIMAIQSAIAQTTAHCIVIAHPKKSDTSGDQRIIQLSDLKGESTIFQDFANVLAVWRPRTADRAPVLDSAGHAMSTIVSLKQRDERGREGNVRLRFAPGSGQYTDHPEELQAIRERQFAGSLPL